MTHRMVRDLVNREEGEPGIMILIRQPEKTGMKIYERIKTAQKSLGLEKRFAVLIDIHAGGILSSMEGEENEWFRKALGKSRQGRKAYEVGGKKVGTRKLKYSDLEGLPVILILCEKGKMGTCCFV